MPAVDEDEIPGESSGVGGAAAGSAAPTEARSAPASPDGGPSGPVAPDAPAMTLRAIFRRFWPYTRSDRSKLLLAFLAMAASTACDTYVVTMFARIVDGATVAHSMAAVWPSAVEWLVLTAVGGLLSVLGGFLLVGAAERFVFRLRHEVFAHLQRLGPGFLGRHATGDLMSRLTADVDGVEALASSGLVSTIIAVGTAVAYAAAAVLVQWQLAVIVVALAPLMWLTSRITGRFTKTAARVERRAAGDVGTAVEQALSNLPLVQAYGTEATESARLDHHGEIWWRARARESRLQMIYSPITTLIQSGALLAVLVAGAAFIASGELTVGGLFGFAAYLGYLYPPLSQLGSLHLTVTSASASCERLIEILDTEPEVQDAPDADASVVREGHVELCGARYVYPGTEDAGLDGVSLDVRPGQFVVVTGPSGAGKSTLTKMLLRFVDAQDGAVLLDGVDVRHRTIKAVRDAVTLLPQEPMLFDLTVAENIAYARPDATRAEVEQAAKEAGALEFIRELPQGFDTPVGEDGGTLSGGQRQRLAIARALLRTSPVLVLDEPTTGLDAPTARAVLEPLRRLAGGRTTIVVSHDLTPARDADLVVVLEDGRIVARGRHHELLAAGGVYGELWAAQNGGSDRGAARVEDAPTGRGPRSTPFRPAPGAPVPRPAPPARPVPPRPSPVRPAALDPAAVWAPDPVTAPLRLLARSSTTTGPTPIRSRPTPPPRTPAAADDRRAGADRVGPARVGPARVGPARVGPAGPEEPAAPPTPRAAGPGAPGTGRPVPRRGAAPAAAPTAGQAPPAVRPTPPPDPSGASSRPAERPAAAGRRGHDDAPAPTGRPGSPRPSADGPSRHGVPAPASRSSSGPSGPTGSSGPPAPTAPSSPGGAWRVPGPRDPASGPTPARREEGGLPATGRLARRTVADLVASTGRPAAPASHRAEPVPPTPPRTTGSHRAPER